MGARAARTRDENDGDNDDDCDYDKLTIVLWRQSWWRQCTIDTNIVGDQISLHHRVTRLTRCRGDQIIGNFLLPEKFPGNYRQLPEHYFHYPVIPQPYPGASRWRDHPLLLRSWQRGCAERPRRSETIQRAGGGTRHATTGKRTNPRVVRGWRYPSGLPIAFGVDGVIGHNRHEQKSSGRSGAHRSLAT